MLNEETASEGICHFWHLVTIGFRRSTTFGDALTASLGYAGYRIALWGEFFPSHTASRERVEKATKQEDRKKRLRREHTRIKGIVALASFR